MSASNFHFRVSRVDRLAETVVHLTGELLGGEIHPECPAVIAGTGIEITIKGVVLVHRPDRPADQVTLMVEDLPIGDQEMVGKDLLSRDNGNEQAQGT